MDKEQEYKLYQEFEKHFNVQIANSLKDESDRAKIILAASWADYYLQVKFEKEYSKGNKKARKIIFSANGPFASFSSKLNIAFCAGWIDSDVYHDIQIIRRLRNECAHTINKISLSEEKYRTEIEKFKVPKRKYFDWNQVGAISVDDSVLIYSGEKPEDFNEDLCLSGNLKLLIAIPVILFVLVSNLKIPFVFEGHNIQTPFAIELPGYMKDL